MKRHFMAASILLLFTVLCLAQGGSKKKGESEENPSRITITIGIGRPSGSNCAPAKSFCLIISLTCANARAIRPEREVKGTARLSGSEMVLELTSALPEKMDAIKLDEDLTLDECTSRALGFSSLAVSKGQYRIEPQGKFGRIAVKTRGQRLATK
jgi:hypothetical protein